MPLELSQEQDDENVLMFRNITPVEKEDARPIVSYATLPEGRLNPDLRNQLGESEIEEAEKNAGASGVDTIHAGKEEIKRGADEKLDPRDTNKDGVVSWGESAVGLKESAKASIKHLPTAAGSVVNSGMDYAKSVGSNIHSRLDYDGDGIVEFQDGAKLTRDAVVEGGKAIREGSGLDDVGRAAKDTTDKALNTAIFLGAGIVLIYALLKM